MTNTTTVPFSLGLKPAIKKRLELEANKADRTTSYLAMKAIEAFLDARETKRQAIETAIREANKGVFISSDAIAHWMDSWESETELPSPEADVFLTSH